MIISDKKKTLKKCNSKRKFKKDGTFISCNIMKTSDFYLTNVYMTVY